MRIHYITACYAILLIGCQKNDPATNPYSAPVTFTVSHVGNPGTSWTDIDFEGDFGIMSSPYEVIYSTNRGMDWFSLPSTVQSTRKIVIRSIANIFLGGHVLLHSSDSGISYDTAAYHTVHDLLFLDNQHAIIAGVDVQSTNDGGSNWTETFTHSGFLGYHHLAKANATTVFAAASFSADGNDYTRVIRSLDKGQTWTQVFDTDQFSILDIDFVSPAIGYMTASNSQLMKTTDSGCS